jgi:biopolymer transport protein ExbB/TolQ
MKRKTLFLKWCIINMVSTTVAVVALTMAASHLKNVSWWTIGFVAVIGVIYLVTEIHAGRISWESDSALEAENSGLALKIARHSSNPIEVAANLCPLVGLLGTIVGVIIAMGGLEGVTVSDFEHAKSEALGGAGVALISTAAGVYACLVLIVEHYVIKHAIDKPQPEKSWV